MDNKQKSAVLQTQWMGFNANIGALYTFFENLSETADKLDNERRQRAALDIAAILRDDPKEIEKEFLDFMPSIDDLDIFPDIREDKTIKESIDFFQDNDFMEKLWSWESKHPHKSYKLARIFFSLFSNPPINGIILRKSMFITLVTFLEVLIESLFTSHYLIVGLTKKEATDKAENLMRGGWNNRLNNLSEIGISSSAFSLYRTEILEITRLRNLFVHNDGMVDEEYLKHPLQDYQGRLKPGDILIISNKRLKQALNKVLVYGFLLCQSHWRYHEDSQKAQNAKIDQFILDCFEKKRFDLVLELSEKLDILNLPDNIDHRVMVDRAIAFRELNKPDEVKNIVAKLQSVTHDWQIDIALSMLSHDYKTLQKQIVDAKSKYDIRKLPHWPLFEPIKNEVWFKMAFMQNRKRINLPSRRR